MRLLRPPHPSQRRVDDVRCQLARSGRIRVYIGGDVIAASASRIIKVDSKIHKMGGRKPHGCSVSVPTALAWPALSLTSHRGLATIDAEVTCLHRHRALL